MENFIISKYVWELIISYITKHTQLCKLRTVNKLLNDLITEKFNKERIWENLCRSKEIEPWINKIMSSLFPSWFTNDYYGNGNNEDENQLDVQDNWRKVYLFYKKMQNFSSNFNLTVITPFNEKINNKLEVTCAAVQGNYIGFGTNNGFIHVRDVPYTTSADFLLPDNERYQTISQIEIFNTSENKQLLVGKLHDNRLFFWDILSGTLINNHQSYDRLFCIDNTLLMSINNSFELRNYEWNEANNHLSISEQKTMNLPDDYDPDGSEIIGAYCDIQYTTIVSKFMSTVDIRKFQQFDEEGTFILVNHFSTNVEIIDPSIPFICHIPLTNMVLIANGINLWIFIIYVTSNRIATKNFVIEFPNTITSVLSHSNSILVGHDDSSFHWYTFNSNYDLIQPAIMLADRWKHYKLNLNPPESIISLKLLVINDTPAVASVTKFNSYILTL